MYAGPRQKFGHHLLMGLGVLPHVQPAQVESENLNPVAQPGQPIVGQQPAAVRAQRGIDDSEVGRHLLGTQIGPQAEFQGVLGSAREDIGGSGGQPATDHPHRATVGLVDTVGLSTPRGQRGQITVDRHQPGRHRQLLLQQGQLAEVVAESSGRGSAGGHLDDVGGHVRVAVTIAPDPGSGPQDWVWQQRGIGPTAA